MYSKKESERERVLREERVASGCVFFLLLPLNRNIFFERGKSKLIKIKLKNGVRSYKSITKV